MACSFPESLLPCLQLGDDSPSRPVVAVRIKYVIPASHPAQCPTRSKRVLNEPALEGRDGAFCFFVSPVALSRDRVVLAGSLTITQKWDFWGRE